MKLFQFIRNLHKTIGLTAPSFDQSNQQRCSFNFRNISILICMIELTISSILYFLFEATALNEQAESFYTCLSEIACISDFLVNIWNVPKMVKLIEKFERFIEKRKFLNLKRMFFSSKKKLEKKKIKKINFFYYNRIINKTGFI